MTRIDISRLIFNSIASRKAVTLPNVGKLWVEFVVVDSGDYGEEASNAVVFSKETDANTPTVLDLLVEEGYSRDEAAQSYTQWLETNTSSYGVRIDGVGSIADGEIRPFNEIMELLNPEEYEQGYDGGGGGSKMKWVWIGIGVVALLALLFWWFGYGRPNQLEKKAEKQRIEQVRVADSLAVATEAARVQAQADSIRAAEVARLEAESNVHSYFHVIAGVFSVEANAHKFVRNNKTRFPNYDFEIIKYRGNRHAVSLYRSKTIRPTVNIRYNAALNFDDDSIWIMRPFVGK